MIPPIKTASLGTGDTNQRPPPPGLPLHSAPSLDYIAPAVWQQRHPFTTPLCAAREVRNCNVT